MAKITHVKSAQQRYATVPATEVDPATGALVQKRTPVMVTPKVYNYETHEYETGASVQKTTKHGKPVFMDVTVADKSKPLPMPTCDACREEIKVGTPYKHISPKSGPYGGRTLTRHESCPTWNVWEYSSSLSARIAQIQNESVDVSGIETEEDATDAVQDIVSQIRDLAEEKREGASNIEDGFGHETESSMALNEVADGLDEWADNLENFDVPELPESEPRWYLVNKDGSGDALEESYESEEDAQAALDNLVADGAANEDEVDVEERTEEGVLSEEQMEEWRAEVEAAITDAISDCNVG